MHNVLLMNVLYPLHYLLVDFACLDLVQSRSLHYVVKQLSTRTELHY